MSEIDRLNREVKALNKQIGDLKNQMNAQYQTMQSDMRRQAQEYERKLRQKAEEQSKHMRDQYDRELDAMRRSFDIQFSQEEKKMADQYLALADELEKARESVLRREAELEQMVRNWTKAHEKKDEQMDRQAREYLDEMQTVMAQVEEKPYETFFPGKMNVYRGTFRNAWNLMKNGLAQAAAAVAVSVRSALERFSLDIDSSQKEWEKEFEEVRGRCDQLQRELKMWENNWIQEEGADSDHASSFCAEADINYWTKGWYLPVKAWLAERIERNQKILVQGITEYLKRQDAVTVDELREEGKRLRQNTEQAGFYQKVYQDTFENARQRAEWAKKITDYMKEKKSFQHDAEEDRMQQADYSLLQQEYFQCYNRRILEDAENTNDFQGWYMMHFYNENDIRVEVCILPVTEDAGRLKNAVQFHVSQGMNTVSGKELLSSIRTALQTALAGSGVKILNTNDKKEKEQLQLHAVGRQIVKEAEQLKKGETDI